jgi:hypothetical protein
VVDVWWFQSTSYYKVDADTMTASAEINYPASGIPLRGIEGGPKPITDGTYIYSSSPSNDLVYRVNIASEAFNALAGGDSPISTVDDGEFLWVANSLGETITKINKATYTITATESVVNNGDLLSRPSRLWILNTITGGGPYGIDVRVYDTTPAVDAVIQNITLSTSLSDASAVVTWENYVYVALRFVDTIYKIDASDYSVVDTLTGIGEPNELIVVGDWLYAIADGDLVKIDPDSMSVEDEIVESFTTRVTTNGYNKLWTQKNTTLVRVDLNDFEVDATCDLGEGAGAGIVYAASPFVPPTPGAAGWVVGSVGW